MTRVRVDARTGVFSPMGRAVPTSGPPLGSFSAAQQEAARAELAASRTPEAAEKIRRMIRGALDSQVVEAADVVKHHCRTAPDLVREVMAERFGYDVVAAVQGLA